MFDIAVEEEISAAHQLRAYQGKCENLHGHNWRVRLEVTADDTGPSGLAIDFSVLRSILNSVIETYDHCLLNEHPDFRDLNPTSENLARRVYARCAQALADHPVRMRAVWVWESPRSVVRYYE